MTRLSPLLAAAGLSLAAGPLLAQDNIAKGGLILYKTNTKTTGIQGIGIPPGADADTNDATTLLLAYERMLRPNVGVELVLGIPPKITARATGTVAFLGDDVLSARNVAPTVLLNYHFGAPGATWRPYLGVGVNYTRFTSIKSSLAPQVEMSDSVGLALQAGVNVAIDSQWGWFASIARVQVKTDLVAVGSTVLTTTIDFRPVTFAAGVSYRF